jgi:RNA polymerase sigma-70 factor (family 1)
MPRNATYNEEELLRLLKGGSEFAFAQIFDRYRPQVYRTARRFLKSTELAEEIVQEVFLKLWLKREVIGEIERLDAFLYTMSRNLTFDALRKLSTEMVAKKDISLGAEQSEDIADHALQETQYSELLQQAVSLLPPQQKQVFHLAKVEGLSHEAIAQQMNISRLTVKAHMAKALQSIRNHLQPHLGTMVFLPFLFYRIFHF